LNQLAQIPQLKVAGRTSSFAFRGQNPNFQEIGEALGVATVLEGSVRKAGNELRITAQLINGQRQCVAVARAATFATHVVIMDEPTAALGVKEGGMVLDLIRRVRDRGLAVVLISHNMPHVFEVADRIHVARLGRRCAVLNPKKIDMSDAVAVMTGALLPERIPVECRA
jgi:ABC-type sugar transport system ATPase subunit